MDNAVTAVLKDFTTLDGLRRRWPYLLAAAGLFGLRLWFDHVGGFEGLGRMALETVDALGLFTPWSMASTYLAVVDPCHAVNDFRGNFVREECVYGKFASPGYYVGALLTTFSRLWSQAEGPGALVPPLLLVVAIVPSVGLVRALQRRLFGAASEFGIVGVTATALITPFVASLCAFVLKWLAIVLLFVLGKVVGAAVVVVTALAVPLWVYRTLRRGLDDARALEALHRRLNPSEPEPAARRDDPPR